ncbi:hypothetical protein [Streptomyces spectabilis]|uniref:Uncharacterized protein n=1 Tax=Streptomyces spectabilis TaxID=68270 RepID=A0A516RBL2_STRST|nr:hypothetical protein [Streptomyces spectabilis]QDQ13045.1 hypothetical protein FH965_22825 [Streptomyces spectabilis]
MGIWQPDPGETALTRTYVEFATGRATPVSGMRWFRDTERKDIQDELPGWPEGPLYTAHSAGGAAGRNVAKVGLKTLYVAVWGALTSQGGSVGPGSRARPVEDRADEVEDFPVVWAAPGTIARTLPWQLDPGRRDGKRYRTHAVVTDRRLLVVGLPYDKKHDELVDDEVLWEVERSRIGRVELRDFKYASDVKVVFSDGSWCRLWTINRDALARYLVYPLDLLGPESLTPELRNAVDRHIARAEAPDPVRPVVSRRACGHYLIDSPAPRPLSGFFGASTFAESVNSDGSELQPGELHPEDL